MYSVVQWLGDGAERDFKIVFAVLPVIGFALLAAGAVAGFGPTRRDVRAVRRCLGAAVFLLVPAASATAQEKEFVLDVNTGVVSQKDTEQDKEIADLKKEVADLKAALAFVTAPAKTSPATGVAAPVPFAPCPCDQCPATRATTAPGVGTPVTQPTFNGEPVPFGVPTYTLAPAGSGGITSGCAGGSCAAPAFRPVRRLFGR